MELQRLLRISTLVGFIIKVMQQQRHCERTNSPRVDSLSFKFLKSWREYICAPPPFQELDQKSRSEPQATAFLCKNVSKRIWVKLVYSVEISKTKASALRLKSKIKWKNSFSENKLWQNIGIVQCTIKIVRQKFFGKILTSWHSFFLRNL